jgi:hypothetical protein
VIVETQDALVLTGSLLATQGALEIDAALDAQLAGKTQGTTVSLKVGGTATIQAASVASQDYSAIVGSLVNENVIAATNVTIVASNSLSNANTGVIFAANKLDITAPTATCGGLFY